MPPDDTLSVLIVDDEVLVAMFMSDLVEDAGLAARMREHIGHQLQGSQAITPAIHKRRANPIARIRWWFAWFVVSVVDYTVTRRLDLGE